MINNPYITFIIVNYNSLSCTEKLIDSLLKYIKRPDFEIVIVDNNSSENGIREISSKSKLIKLYLLEENTGFAKANNYASENTKSNYLVFVNPDILFIEECISPLIEFMDGKQNIGACAPRLLNEDGTVQDSLGIKMGLFYEFLEAFYLINLFRKIYRFKLKIKKNNLAVKVGWLSAALMIVRKDVFKSVGGFDSGFFLNYEDIDLCRRLQEKSFDNYYFPAQKSIHYSHQSFNRDYRLLVTSRYISRILYAKKHYNVFVLFLVSILQIFGILLRLLTVNFLYSGDEKKQRRDGYKFSLKLYFGNSGNGDLSFAGKP